MNRSAQRQGEKPQPMPQADPGIGAFITGG